MKKMTIVIVGVLLVVSVIIIINKTSLKNSVNEEEKIVLKLNHFINDELDGESAKEKNANIKFANVPETSLKTYEKETYLEVFTDYIKYNLEVNIDNKWKYIVHYYNEENTSGMIEFIYTIGEIETNKIVLFTFENNAAIKVYYKHLDKEINETELLARLETFKNTHIQEKMKLKEKEKILEERVKYIYSYSVFFSDSEIGPIVDSGSEYYID